MKATVLFTGQWLSYAMILLRCKCVRLIHSCIQSASFRFTVCFGSVYSLFWSGLQTVFCRFTDCKLPLYSLFCGCGDNEVFTT